MAHATRRTINPVVWVGSLLAQAARESFYFSLLAVSAYLMLALASHTPSDSAWSYAGWAAPHNASGWMGAWLADTLYHFLGASAYLLPAGLLVLILASLRDSADALAILLQLLGLAFIVSGHSLWMTLYPSYLTQPLVAPPSGILGLFLIQQVELYLGYWGVVTCTALSLSLGASLLLRVSLLGLMGSFIVSTAAVIRLLVKQVTFRAPKAESIPYSREAADQPKISDGRCMKYTLNPITWTLWVLDGLGETVLTAVRMGRRGLRSSRSQPQMMADVLITDADSSPASLEPAVAPKRLQPAISTLPQASRRQESLHSAQQTTQPSITTAPESKPLNLVRQEPSLILEPWLAEPANEGLSTPVAPIFFKLEADAEFAQPLLTQSIGSIDPQDIPSHETASLSVVPAPELTDSSSLDAELIGSPDDPYLQPILPREEIDSERMPLAEPCLQPAPLVPPRDIPESVSAPVVVVPTPCPKTAFISVQHHIASPKVQLPGVDLLDPIVPRATTMAYTPDQLEELSRQVEARLADFGVKVNVMGTEPGPVITRFELLLAPGTKASKITGLARDLARSLSINSIRVVEVIPGKAFVGLELPNKHRESVRLSEIIQAREYIESNIPTLLALGKDVSGKPSMVNLTKLPHLLVAGTTGSGKSVAINAMIISLLYKATAEEVRMIMIDPKMLELSIYDGIPHLLTPVVTDMRKAANALRWCVGEMERRYHLMATQKVRDIIGYNIKVSTAVTSGHPIPDPSIPRESLHLFAEQPTLTPLPYIVVIIDELADMMMMVGKKVEELIARLAQKARACGIHLILATQRPSVDVLTGLIKANVPARISFQVSSKIDSRTILDQMGAESLLGQGDMLYLGPGSSGVPTRYHGAFVADHEVHRIVEFLKLQGQPDYIDEILDDEEEETPAAKGGEGNDSADGEKDPLYDEAVKIVVAERKASTSWVQRRLRIGYNRAARIVEAMEAAGLVGKPQQNGVREVLIERHEI